MAALAASLTNDGPGKSGNPCPRFTAPCWLANRLISVKTEVPKPRTRGEATSLVRSAPPSIPSFLDMSALEFACATLPAVICRFSLILCPVLTKNGAQGIRYLTECCSGAQGFSHRRQKVSSGTGCLGHVGQGSRDDWPVLGGLVGPDASHLPAHRVIVDDLQRDVDVLFFSIAIDPNDDLTSAFALDLATERIFSDRILDESVLDRDDRTPARLHLAQPLTRPLLDLVGQVLDKIRTSKRIRGAGNPRLVRQDLLRSQCQCCRVLGRQS